jgi:hypothetical protein
MDGINKDEHAEKNIEITKRKHIKRHFRRIIISRSSLAKGWAGSN